MYMHVTSLGMAANKSIPNCMNDNCMKASVHDGNHGSTEAHKGQLAN